jgi:hypothetical protein
MVTKNQIFFKKDKINYGGIISDLQPFIFTVNDEDISPQMDNLRLTKFLLTHELEIDNLGQLVTKDKEILGIVLEYTK